MKKGQALLLVFFIFIVIGIVTSSLAVMWKAEVNSRVLERDSLGAFYIAQAGIEYAKAVLYYHYDYWLYWYYWPLYYWPASEGNANFGGGSYTVTVSPDFWAKTLVSTGTYGKATRKVSCTLDLNSYYYYNYGYYVPSVHAWSWQEQ